MQTSQVVPLCGKHHIPKEWSLTTFEYGEV